MIPKWIELGWDIEAKDTTPSWFKQVHGTRAIPLGRTPEATPPEADAGFTREKEIAIHVFTADCVPILLWSESSGRPIAAIHAGWRGALAGIVRSTMAALDAPAHSIQAWIGPSIGKCCFEVKEDFVQAFRQSGRPLDDYLETSNGKTRCDLVRFIVDKELKDIPHYQVDQTQTRCTVCSTPQLPSYRRNGGTDPRIRSWIRKV